MNTALPKEIFEFGSFVLDPARRSLTGEEGREIPINPKAFDALVYLVQRAGTVVERSELYAALWPQTIVEENNLNQTIAAVRRALGDTEEQRFIVTVPRRGYQFVAPVVRRSLADSGAEPRSAAVPSARSRTYVAIAMFVVSALAIYAGVRMTQKDSLQPPVPRVVLRSIAVLPFENLSPDPTDTYFADGLHEELLTKLAKLEGVTVIGRTSVLAYANARERSLISIAEELGVASIIEGSVRHAPDRVRVTVRLVEGRSGAQLWSETYDARLDDTLNIQSDIATKVAIALDSELTPAAREKLAQPPTQSMAAYSAYLKGLALYRSSGAIGVSMPPQVRESIQHYLDEALAHDPNFAAALGWRAQIRADSLQFDSFPLAEREAHIAELAPAIARDARDALAIDPSLGIAYAALARLHFFNNRLDDALAALEDAKKLAPDDSTIWQAAAVLHIMRDEPTFAIEAARRAIELDPRTPGPYSLLSIGLRITAQYEDAKAAAERMIEIAPTAAIGYVALARLLTDEGDTPRIRETLRAAEQLLGNTRNLKLDLALSYASIGAHEDARRLVDDFRNSMAGKHIDPGLEAMALLATREYDQALAALSSAIAQGRRNMDQMPLTLIRHNTWNDPVLDSPEWIEMRKSLSFSGRLEIGSHLRQL